MESRAQPRKTARRKPKQNRIIINISGDGFLYNMVRIIVGTLLDVGTGKIKPEEILEINPDLIFLSNGPGDPEDLDDVIANLKELIGKKPIAGICLGHQLLALTLGGQTGKLKFGHRGGNHPVKDLEDGKVYITSQNHGYYVSQMPENMSVTHINLNDNTVEGMRHKELPIYSVQYHPEACPGPKDNDYIFDKFLELV